MIVTRTPLRISFFGGGSDLPRWYENHLPGLTISATIDRYIDIVLNNTDQKHIRLVYSDIEHPTKLEDIKNSRIRYVLQHCGIPNRIELASFSSVTTNGSGLGSSSAFTVGLINACRGLRGFPAITKYQAAEMAYHIETVMCGDKIGRQDQYAAAFGGFNAIKYDDGVVVSSINLTTTDLLDLGSRFKLYSTGITRTHTASTILANIDEGDFVRSTRAIVNIAHDAYDCFKKKEFDALGDLLDESWHVKRLMGGVTNPQINDMYEYGKRSGASGAKLLGAGGGG